MLKANKKQILLSVLVILLPVLAGAVLWGSLPERLPIHWNAAGEVDGWASKPFAVFAIPGFVLAVHLLCVFVTSLDPKHRNIQGKMLSLVFWICPAVALAVSGAVYSAALGADLSMEIWGMVLMGVLFLLLGNWLPKCQPNYTVGIKLPWTIHSEDNWRKTHRMAGPIWMAGGLVILACSFLGELGVWVMIATLVVVTLIPTVYSYRLYRKSETEKS